MIIKDRRTDAQKESLRWLVAGTIHTSNYKPFEEVWACGSHEEAVHVAERIRAWGEPEMVRIVESKNYHPSCESAFIFVACRWF